MSCDGSSSCSDLHWSVLEGVVITLEWPPVNSISDASVRSTEVLPIEVSYMAGPIPPSPFISDSTVCVWSVIVLVICTEGCTIVSCKAIACCAFVATNIESILGPSIANREKSVIGISRLTIKISKAHFELSAFYPWSEAVNILQTQPVFTFRITEAIYIAGPVAVEVNRAIHSLRNYIPLSVIVHITVHLEWPATTRINGVHSRDSAATVIYRLAVTWEMFGAQFTWEIKGIGHSLYMAATFLSSMMSTFG